MKEKLLKNLELTRVDLSKVENTMKTLPNTRYSSLALTALELGRMYFGEIALTLGKEYPYEKTKEATTPEGIQAAVDVSNEMLFIEDNEIIKLNKLRGILDTTINSVMPDVIEAVDNMEHQEDSDDFAFMSDIMRTYTSLKEARMWLGKRLGEIRDNIDNVKSNPTPVPQS